MHSSKEHLPQNIIYLLFIAATIVYIAGLFIPVMEVDAAQYAAISREMMENHHYLEVFNRGQNYLDKPPLLFWLGVISFKIFGVNTVAYKLPSFLFSLLGVYSTFRLAKYLYDRETGLLAALVLYTCQAFFLFNNDVRTDTLLTANVIFSAWQLILFSDSKKWHHLVLGFLGLALALLSKGPISIIVVGSALFTHFVLKREWKKIFQWQWIAGIAITLILLSPMVYGLYLQFGSDGPRFFFWTQSFGRITGESPWKNDAGYFNFIHVFGWSMLPWTIITASAIVFLWFQVFREKFSNKALPEYYTLGGFTLPFIALSLSNYKLPHYIFVLYPFAAILSANFILRIMNENERTKKIFGITQGIIILGVLALAVIINVVWFPADVLFWIPALIGIIFCFWWWMKPANAITRIVFPTALLAISVNWLLSTNAYPSLLKYQGGAQLAKLALNENLDKNSVYFFNYATYDFEFYFQKTLGQLNDAELREKISSGEHISVIGREDLLKMLHENNRPPKKIISVNDFHVSQLNTTFLNRSTRNSALTKIYLVEF